MKKLLLLSTTLLVAASYSFGQKANVTKAESLVMQDNPDFKGAREAILPALKEETTKNDAKTYYIAGLIGEKENDNLFVKLQMGQKIDSIKKGQAITESYKYYLIADSLDNLPNEKGKVKPRFSKKIVDAVKEYHNQQHNFYWYGSVAYNNQDYKTAYDAFTTYLAIPSLPMMKNAVFTTDATANKYIKYYAAYSAVKLEKHQEAIKLYKELKNDTVNTNAVYQLLATEYMAIKDTANYVATLKEGFEKFKEEPWFIGNIINHYIYTKKMDEASKYLDELIAKSPNVAGYYVAKGDVESRLKNYDEAKAAYKKAIDLEPKSDNAYYGLGILVYNDGYLLDESSQSIKDNNLYNKERSKATEVFKQALPYLQKAYELKSDDSDYKQALRQLYYRLQMMKEYESLNN